MGTEPGIRVRAKQTPEGAAFYPFGSWGGGYLLDAVAERRLKVWSRRWRWVVIGVVTLFIPDFMPGNLGLRFAASLLAITALQHVCYWLCVRDCRRTAVLLSADESLRMQAAVYGAGVAGLQGLLLALAAGFLVWRCFYAPYPHWGLATAIIDLALCAWAAAYLVRLGAMQRRLDRKTSSQPALWMRRR